MNQDNHRNWCVLIEAVIHIALMIGSTWQGNALTAHPSARETCTGVQHAKERCIDLPARMPGTVRRAVL